MNINNIFILNKKSNDIILEIIIIIYIYIWRIKILRIFRVNIKIWNISENIRIIHFLIEYFR